MNKVLCGLCNGHGLEINPTSMPNVHGGICPVCGGSGAMDIEQTSHALSMGRATETLRMVALSFGDTPRGLCPPWGLGQNDL